MNNNNNYELPSSYLCELNDWEWMKFKQESSISELTRFERVGVALIGMGRMGMIHMRNLLAEVQANLLYCFDSDSSRVRACSSSPIFRELNIQVFPSEQLHLALEDPRVKAIIIATPTFTHEKYIRLALEAGKNVLCEKPLTSDTDSIQPLYELAAKKRVFLLCAFNRRYDPDFRHVHERTAGKSLSSLGALHLVKITSRDSQRPPLGYLKNSGGLFHDSAVHDIDMCLWLTRQLPDIVQVIGKTWKEQFERELAHDTCTLANGDGQLTQEIDDFFLAVITLKFPDGTIGVIDNARQTSYGYDQRCEVYGDRGMLNCIGKRPLNFMDFTEQGIRGSNINYNFASRYNQAYKNELKDILTMAQISQTDLYSRPTEVRRRLLEPNRPMLVVATHRIADACLKASKIGQPISLNWSEEFKSQFMRDIN